MKRTEIRRVSSSARTRRAAWTEFRREVWERDREACVMCGWPTPLAFAEIHHRLLKSRGGEDTHENCITLCGSCHHQKVHKHPAWAACVGLMVPRGFTPTEWPALLDANRIDWDLGGPMLWQLSTAAGWISAQPHPDQQAIDGPWAYPGTTWTEEKPQ